MDLEDLLRVALMCLCLPCASFTMSLKRGTPNDPMTDSCRNGTLQSMTSSRGSVTVHSTGHRRVCKFVLIAPRGEYIELHRIEFRANRRSSCDQEHVAIYDGKNDSAPLMALFCKDEHQTPPKIGFASKGRYIYMEVSTQDIHPHRFHFSTEYKKWKTPPAVPFPVCTNFSRLRSPTDHRGGYITSHDGYPGPYSQQSNTSVPCQLNIVTHHEVDRIYVKIVDVPSQQTDETLDCLQVIDKNKSGGDLLGQFCGQATGDVTSVSSNLFLVLTNRSKSTNKSEGLGFLATFTIYYFADEEEGCTRHPTDFQCRNGWCIDKWMRCDGTYHCPDKTDEIACSALSAATYTLILSSLGLVALSTWTVAMVIIWRRSMRRKRQFHEQSSRDSRRRNASERSDFSWASNRLETAQHDATECSCSCLLVSHLGRDRYRQPRQSLTVPTTTLERGGLLGNDALNRGEPSRTRRAHVRLPEDKRNQQTLSAPSTGESDFVSDVLEACG